MTDLFFKLKDSALQEKFSQIKEKIEKNLVKSGKLKGGYLTNIECFRKMIDLLHDQFHLESSKIKDKLKEVQKSLLIDKIKMESS